MNKQAEKRTVLIHNREYETVASRVQRFREKHGDAYSITTEIISADDERVVMVARIGGDKGWLATGHAEERRDSSTINETSALENAETSAIGRALAAFGLAGTEFATADEITNAISQRKPAVGSAPVKPVEKLATPVQKSQIKAFLTGLKVAPADMVDFLEDNFGITPGSNMTAEDAANIIRELRDWRENGSPEVEL